MSWQANGIAWLVGLARATGLLLVALASVAHAATINIETTEIEGKSVSFIVVEGDLEYGDELRFADIAIRLPSAVVLLASPGGNLHAGIEIGRAIRLKGYATWAAEPQSCASACALAWLGGTPRMMSEERAVGFHAAWSPDGATARPDSVGNALVGAYLNQLGLTPNAIAYVTEAQPEGMQWMTFADAEAVGIAVVSLTPDTPEREPPVARETPSSDDWASFGDWIQIYSRASLNEAIELGMAYRREFPSTFVFRYDNGWYVVALGPYPDRLAARRERDSLVRARRIPQDSLVNGGERFMELVWGAAPQQPGIATRDTGEALALAAAEEFFSATSASGAKAMAYLAGIYPPQVDYYGRRTPRADVLQEKRDFVNRWPERRYVLREGASVVCRPGGDCIVDGLVDWRAHSAPRRATSTGTARFTLAFRRQGGSLVLLGESSTVITRNVRQSR